MAASRPDGYLDDVLSKAVRVDEAADAYDVTDEHWAAMRTKYRPRGLGDVVARFTSAVGIKPCGGCKGRQTAMNRAVPFK